MFKAFRTTLIAAIMITTAIMLAGCGEEKEDNVPSVKLTASAVLSQADASTHTHEASISFSSISASPTADVQIRSSTANGHSHVIALSPQQIIDLNNGMKLTLTSSTPDAGIAHTHLWSIQGGNVLYEKFCYNCHTNDKRGHNPMNVSFNANQTNAVKNPASAPSSTSTPAVPDPGYSPIVETSLDGVYLYGKYCASCHGPLASSSKPNRTAAQIKAGMGSMGLSDSQLQAIATALLK
jgi:mono/diheme cytochrome c family protein